MKTSNFENLKYQRSFKATSSYDGVVYLFLDFDGVLHNMDDIRRGSTFSFNFKVDDLLKEFPNLKLVLSTSWLHSDSYEECKRNLTPLMRERLAGHVDTDLCCPTDQNELGRSRGCYKWLMDNDAKAEWVAVDDAAFFCDDDPVVWTNGELGLVDPQFQVLREALKNPVQFKQFTIDQPPAGWLTQIKNFKESHETV